MVKTISVKLTKPIDRTVETPTISNMTKKIDTDQPKVGNQTMTGDGSLLFEKSSQNKSVVRKLKRKLKPEDQITFDF